MAKGTKHVLCEEILYNCAMALAAKHPQLDGEGIWLTGMMEAAEPDSLEQMILSVICFLAAYGDRHYQIYGQPIVDDPLLGPSWFNILIGMRDILKAGTGQLDRQILDKLLLEMAETQGFDVDCLSEERESLG